MHIHSVKDINTIHPPSENNEISVWNNGCGIPVEVHTTEKKYVPELIFGTLLTSSNYDDNQKKVVDSSFNKLQSNPIFVSLQYKSNIFDRLVVYRCHYKSVNKSSLFHHWKSEPKNELQSFNVNISELSKYQSTNYFTCTQVRLI